MSDTTQLTTLWSAETKYLYENPTPETLEVFKNQNHEQDYLVPFYCNEFTSLCPKTWQPDFAKLHILYVPNEDMVESKSLKLYLFSFRNSWEFHEDVCNRIANDLENKLSPKYIMVYGDFNVRGGIAIKPIIERTYWASKDRLDWYRYQVDLYFKNN